MGLTKYNIQRIKRLLAMLKENRYPNYPRFLAEMKRQDIAGAYNLSARTLQRDIAFLKSEYSAPIEYDFEQRGYYLTDPDWSVDIPLLEDSEMRAAVLGARLAENLMPAPVKQEMRSAVDTLLAVNDKGMDEKAVLLSLVALGSRAAVKPEVFRVIFDAWQKHQCVKVRYNPVTESESERLIEPHALAFYEGNWYINQGGFTHERRQSYSFRKATGFDAGAAPHSERRSDFRHFQAGSENHRRGEPARDFRLSTGQGHSAALGTRSAQVHRRTV